VSAPLPAAATLLVPRGAYHHRRKYAVSVRNEMGGWPVIQHWKARQAQHPRPAANARGAKFVSQQQLLTTGHVPNSHIPYIDTCVPRVLWPLLREGLRPSRLRPGALEFPSVEHFVLCHPDSRLHKCSRILYRGSYYTYYRWTSSLQSILDVEKNSNLLQLEQQLRHWE
jgi:hypothetical protein